MEGRNFVCNCHRLLPHLQSAKKNLYKKKILNLIKKEICITLTKLKGYKYDFLKKRIKKYKNKTVTGDFL